MADEGDKLLSVPGVMEGKVRPDYNRMIQMATQEPSANAVPFRTGNIDS